MTKVALSQIIHDNYTSFDKKAVEEISQDLLGNLNQNAKPLEAARIAYALALLQLKSEHPNEAKALRFIDNLKTILKHEIGEAEDSSDEKAGAHLIYVRKLAEQYFHHLMLFAEKNRTKKAIKKLSALRKMNHDNILSIQKTPSILVQMEQKKIEKLFRNHFIFTGMLFIIALYLAWSTFWGLMDFVMSSWVYSEFNSSIIFALSQKALLLIFSISFIFGFVKYQSADDPAPEAVEA